MYVKMIHGLAAVCLAVDNKACALFTATVALGKLLGLEKQTAEQGRIGTVRFHDIPDVLFRDHQEMHRRLGVKIMKGQSFIVFIYFFGRDFTFNYFAKYTFTHTCMIQHILKILNPLPGLFRHLKRGSFP